MFVLWCFQLSLISSIPENSSFIISSLKSAVHSWMELVTMLTFAFDSGWLVKLSIHGKKLVFVINTRNFIDTIGQKLVPHHAHHNKSVTKEINTIVTEFWCQQNIWKCVLLWLPKVKYKRSQKKKNQKDFILLWLLFDCLKRLNLWRCFYNHAYYALRFKDALTWRAYV